MTSTDTRTSPYVLFGIITGGTYSPDACVVAPPRLCVELIEPLHRVITALLVPEEPCYTSSLQPLVPHYSVTILLPTVHKTISHGCNGSSLLSP
jgi:hypothetical protein